MEDCLFKDVCKTPCKPTCLRYLEMNYLLKSSQIPKVLQKVNQLIPEPCDLQSFECLAYIRDFICDFVNKGDSLYLYSKNCGNGKTTWSIKLMINYFAEIWAGNGFEKRGLFINVPMFLSECKSQISHPTPDFDILKKDLLKVDLVIWDDIASTKLSDYDYNILLTYIDRRWLERKSNIYTGNVEPEQLNLYLGNRLSSRINSSQKIKLCGGDNRQ